MSGNGVSAVHGVPDVNLLTMTEVAAAAQVIVQVSRDPGHRRCRYRLRRSLVNVKRCVEEFEAAGLAAMHLEDQPFPKRCASHEGGTLCSIEEMVERIKLAIEARRDPDFVLIARTDATIDDGDASRRLNAYRDAGADVLFNCSITSVEQAQRNIAEVPGFHLYNYRGADRGPQLKQSEIRAMGYRILTYSVHGLRLMARSYMTMLQSLQHDGDMQRWIPQMITPAEYNEITGVNDFYEFERRHPAVELAGSSK